MIDQNWIEALESNKFIQTKGKLFDPWDRGYCCLGVAARVCNGLTNDEIIDIGEEYDQVLPSEIAESLGLNEGQMAILAALNDGGTFYLSEDENDGYEGWYGVLEVPILTFKEIAQVLREYNETNH